jgi:hypothetical protein
MLVSEYATEVIKTRPDKFQKKQKYLFDFHFDGLQ